MKACRRIFAILSAALLAASLILTPLCNNKIIVVVSGSMEPTIRTYALTLVHFCDVADVDVGDIVVYYHPGFDELITHRVVTKGSDYVWTQGDANNIADDIAVVADNLYGKVFYVANWAVPIMQRFVSDRQFNRGAMIAALMVVALIAIVGCFVISLFLTYVTALVFALSHRVYPDDEVNKLCTITEGMRDVCAHSSSLSITRQMRLRVAYRVWRRQIRDIEDELNKIQGVRKK